VETVRGRATLRPHRRAHASGSQRKLEHVGRILSSFMLFSKLFLESRDQQSQVLIESVRGFSSCDWAVSDLPFCSFQKHFGQGSRTQIRAESLCIIACLQRPTLLWLPHNEGPAGLVQVLEALGELVYPQPPLIQSSYTPREALHPSNMRPYR